jgi:hypothetical protein
MQQALYCLQFDAVPVARFPRPETVPRVLLKRVHDRMKLPHRKDRLIECFDSLLDDAALRL